MEVGSRSRGSAFLAINEGLLDDNVTEIKSKICKCKYIKGRNRSHMKLTMLRENVFRVPQSEHIHRIEVESQNGLIYAAQVEHRAILTAPLEIVGSVFFLGKNSCYLQIDKLVKLTADIQSCAK